MFKAKGQYISSRTGDVSLNILMYADDIVLFAENKEGLQNFEQENISNCPKIQNIQ